MAKQTPNLEDAKKLIEDECKLRGYSAKTIKNYMFFVDKFINSKKSPQEFILSLINAKKSDDTVRSACFAIKFYLRILEKEDKKIETLLKKLPNVKREKKLPMVLSKKEVEKLIMATKNINYRLMIMLAYSAGLRVSELVNLKWEDIDFSRNIIHIKHAKGKKDRIVMLSPKVKKLLRTLSEDKTGYILKTHKGTKYSARTIQTAVKSLAKKAGINKKVTPHILRHSFATHLLDKGIDIRYIKELLGHSNISTTQIYTRLSNKKIANIKTPLDA